MRRTNQRQLGARRCARVGAEASRARQFITELVRAHAESIALVRMLLLAHERADRRQSNADHAAALAAANPADTAANARAIDAAAQAEAAHLAEMYAADKWASHVMHLHGLIAMTDELGCNPVPSPGPEGTTAAAATAPARIRSRADCLGRPG